VSSKHPFEKLLDSLEEQSLEYSSEQLDKELEFLGIDAEAATKRAKEFVAMVKKEHRMSWRKMAARKRQTLKDRGQDLRDWSRASAEVIQAAFEELMSTSHGEIAIAFRKRGRKNLSTEEMARILQDTERMETSPNPGHDPAQ